MTTSPDLPAARAGMTLDLGAASSLTLKAVAADTGGAYALMEYVGGPGAGSGFHTHGHEDEAFYVLRGDLTFVLGEQTIVAAPGDYIHIPKGLRHAFQNQTSEPIKALIIVSPAGLEQFFVDLIALLGSTPADQPDPEALTALAQQYQIRFE